MELFTVKEDSEVGRYAVASRSLKPGEVIFSESPFAFGPKSYSPVLCLSCFAPLDGTITLCSVCKWPICGPDCESNPHHKDNECAIFAASQIKFQPVEDPTEVCLQYECITPLRVLLAKEKNPERWEREISGMESHSEIRRSKPIWEFNRTNIVEYLRGPCKLNFSEELIQEVCGILDVNAFEARASSGYLIRCLYPKLAIFSHNCISNINHSINSEDFSLKVRAAVEIPQDSQLFSSYTYSLWPTLVRREFLKESKYFDCKCERCSDSTELRTHMGTLKCGKCDNGVILSTSPLSDSCEWKCTHCEFKTNAFAVRKVYSTVQEHLDGVEMLSGDEGIQQREALYRKFRSVFHPNNAYLTMLRIGLSQLYGRAEGYTVEDLPDLLLERKVELCYQLLEVLNVVEPGFSRIRGVTLYELHAPLMILARNQYVANVIERGEFRKKMEEAVDILGKSVEILENEPESTPEGQLGVVAKQAHKGLLENFEVLIKTA